MYKLHTIIYLYTFFLLVIAKGVVTPLGIIEYFISNLHIRRGGFGNN